MTFRRVRILLDRLPPESITKTAMRENLPPAELAARTHTEPDSHGPWSHTEMLLARVIDQLGIIEYAVYRSQGGKPPEPKPTPRPGVKNPDADKTVVPLNTDRLAALKRMRGE